MEQNKGKPNRFKKLRKLAEKRLLEMDAGLSDLFLKDMDGLIHELEVHQIELEMQNEELRQTQLDLEAARDKYSNLYNFAPVGYFSINDKGLILDANFVCARLLGTERGRLTGQRFTNFIAKDDQNVFYLHRQKLFKTKTKQVCELKLTNKDGTEFYAQLESDLVKDEEAGNYSVIRSSLCDITERKQAEMALIATKQEIESIVKTVPDIIYRLDPNGRITFVSDSVKRYGYLPEELIGTNVMKMVYPEDKKNTIHRIKERRTGDRSTKSFETRLITKNQMPVSFEVFIISAEGLYSPATNGQGTFMGTQGIARDITESKQVEEALRQSQEKITRLQKMESLGLLAGGVAHDLNNVLSGIVGYPELLLLDLPGDSKLRKPIETIQTAGHRAVAIVQDLLTVARGVATMKEPLSLNDITRDYLRSPEFYKFKEYHPAVTLKTNLDTDLLNISGSVVHIRKVVMNLISNAAEAIEGSGTIALSTVNRYIDKPLRGYDDVKTGKYAVLAVSDDGSGISSEDLERIFEPFYTKKVMGRSGTGLGLAVVWNVVQDHKGYVDVQSTENGTTFELHFPITREAIADRESSLPIGDYKGAGETILVVDDIASQREIACDMLSVLGYKTTAVSSGEAAVEYLQAHAVDLILLDMIMDPGITGRETYERVIKINPNQKAIITSGFAETDEVREAQRLGAGRFIKKPFTLEKIGFALKDELKS